MPPDHLTTQSKAMTANVVDLRNESVEIKVLIDQVKSLDASLVGSRLGSTFIVLLAVWFFRDHIPQLFLLMWLIAQLAFNGGYLWFGLRSRPIPINAQNASQRLRNNFIFSLVSGLLWGAGVLMMWMPDNFEKQMIVIFFIVGMASGAMHALNAYLASFFGFLIPCVGSVIVASLWAGDQYSLVVSLATASHLLIAIQYSKGIHRTLINSIRKHHEADVLALKLQIQKDIAESATLAKSRFLAAASHDLRQPMHALNLYLGALGHFDLPLAARPVLASVRECAETMDEMFCAMLDISRLDANVLIAKNKAFPIAQVLEKIHSEFIQQAQAKGLQFRVATCSATVTGDQELIANILRNLVSNALRYTKHGRVLLGCRRNAGSLSIAVYDTGIGIAPDQQSLVFDEFYQVGNRERDRSQGLGLGLAIVQRQARLMNAKLSLRSQLGRGSVFAIEVPRIALHSTKLASNNTAAINRRE
jgi:signal transduction histidine kinase